MKKGITFIVSLIFICLSACRAQQISDVKKSTVSAKKETFAVSRQEENNLIQVGNVKNTLYEKRTMRPKNAWIPDKADNKLDESKVADIFKTVFPPERLKEVSNDTKVMIVKFITTTLGELKEVSFVISPNTSSITTIEIEKLEKLLKENIRLSLNQKVYKGYDHVVVTRFVVFKRLLNNEPNAVE